MKHYASSAFWQCYRSLPEEVRRLADRAYERLKEDPSHPSLHFKKVGRFRSVKDAVERGSIRRGAVFYMEEVLS